MEVLEEFFLGTSFNIDMSIILHAQITVVGNDPTIIQLPSIYDESSTIMSSPIFDEPILFNACFIIDLDNACHNLSLPYKEPRGYLDHMDHVLCVM